MSPEGLKASDMLLGKSRGELPIVMNRFKGLDLVNRVSEKLLTEIHNSVQEVANNTIPKKKKCKKAKWLSEEALQIAEERREAKKQGREGKVHPINTESQKIARRDKEGLL